MLRTATIQSAIRSELVRQGSCSLDALFDRLPQFTWNEIFTVVDQLSREGPLVLRRPARFHYELSISLSVPNVDPVPASSAAVGNLPSGPGDVSVQPRE
jgi:hypothetical protein